MSEAFAIIHVERVLPVIAAYRIRMKHAAASALSKIPWLVGLVALIVAAGCHAEVQNPRPVKPRWLSAEEAKALDNDEAKARETDVFVAMAAGASDDASRRKDVTAAVLLTKYYLHQLFYPVNLEKTIHPADDPEFYATLSDFERRAGLAVDGKFTFAEFSRLAYLASVETETEISTITKFVHVDNAYASATGTWTMQADTIADPVNRSEIRCSRFDSTCTVFTASVLLPSEKDLGGSKGGLLTTDVQYYDVTRWTPGEVQALAKSECRQTTLTMNAETQQVYEVTTDLTREGCPVLGALKQPRVTTLEDGFRLIRKVYEARQAPARTVSRSPMGRIRELMQVDSNPKTR
jgi:hypothetical protein